MIEINAQEIENQQPLELASNQGSQIDSLLANEATLAAQNLQAVQESAGGIESEIQNLLMESGQESAFRSQLEQQQGLPQQQQRLSELSNLANLETARLSQQLLQTEGGAIGTMESRNFLNAQEARARRESAINTLTLSAEASIIQGNIQTATALIDRAVEARFEPVRHELEIQMFNLNRLDKRFLEPAMRRDAESRERQIGTQIKQLEEQKNKIQQISLEAAKYGANSSVVSRIMQAKDFKEAIEIGASYLGEPFRLQADMQEFQKRVELASLQLQRDKFNFDLNKIKKETQQRIQQEQDIEKDAQQRIARIDTILAEKMPGIRTASGTFGFQRNLLGALTVRGGVDALAGGLSQSREVTSAVASILESKWVQNVVDSKNKGAAYGSLSNEEGARIGTAVEELSNIVDKNSQGQVIGFRASPDYVVERLEVIREGYSLHANRRADQLIDSVLGTNTPNIFSNAGYSF